MGYLDKEKTDELNKLKRERKIGNLDSPKNPFDYYEREYGTMPRDTERAPFQWASEVAYKNVHRIVARGYDTTELMEEGYGVIEVLFVDYDVLSRVDLLILLEVYAAGETPITGADSRNLCNSIRQRGKVDPIYIEGIHGVEEVIDGLLKDGDIVMTQGAGETAQLARNLAVLWGNRRVESQ